MNFYSSILIVLIAFGTLVACDEVSKQVIDDARNEQAQVGYSSENNGTIDDPKTENEQDNLSKEEKRLYRLLSQFSSPLEDEAVEIDLKNFNPINTKGFKVKGSPVKAMAYLFDHQDAHNDVFNYLMSEESDGKFHTLISSNGGWLLWVYSEEDRDELSYVVNDLASAFAGEE